MSSTSIGLGTAAIGRPQYINLRQERPAPFSLDEFRARGKQVLDAAYQAGVRYFDTAPGYGLAQDLMIEWAQEKAASDLEIATKWGYTYTANFDPNAEVHEVKEHSLERLNHQWQQSEKLLPYLSTYQIHSATFASGVLENAEVLKRLQALKESHHLKIGLTVSGADQVDIARAAMEIAFDGQPLFEVYQITYNLLDQSLGEIAGDLKAEGHRIVIKEAMANGRLFPNPNYPHYAPLYTELLRLAQQYRVGIDAIALRFCLDSLEPFSVLSGAATPQHIQENLQAQNFSLRNEEVEKLKNFAMATKVYWQERKQLNWN